MRNHGLNKRISKLAYRIHYTKQTKCTNIINRNENMVAAMRVLALAVDVHFEMEIGQLSKIKVLAR